MSQEDPSELTPVQQLLRLKRHEKPADDFVEDFIAAFHERQRSELLKQSARGLLWERASMYWENYAAPKWGIAAAAAVAVMAAAWWLMPVEKISFAKPEIAAQETGSDLGFGEGFSTDAIMILASDPDDASASDSSLLLSRHFSGGYADDARHIKAVRPQPAADSLTTATPRGSRADSGN